MLDFIIRVATETDVPQLVTLANQYTYQNLSAKDREAGFLTGIFTDAALRNMILSAPCVVAYYQEELAGFIINTKLPADKYPPLVQQIIHLIPDLKYQNIPLTKFNYFFYGPVLVAKRYRRQGLLHRMFQESKAQLCPPFELGIAFIDQDNQASLLVHTQNLGMVVIGEIIFNARSYNILAFQLT